MGQPTLSILFPVYNERDNLRPLLKEILSVLAPMQISFEIIAVDDGSKDGSKEVLRELHQEIPQLRVIFFRRNIGQSAAFDAGFRSAQGKYLITMDADRQNDPSDIPKLLAKLKEDYDFVTGWRKNRRDGFFLRTFPSRIANWIIRRVTGSQFRDLGCSLKGYRREIYTELHIYGEMHRFIAVLAQNLGARCTEVESNHRPRVAGVSKYGLSRTFKVLFDLVTVWFWNGYQTKPIYVFGTVGAFAISGSLAATAIVLYQKFALDIWVHRNPLLLVALFAGMVGTQFLALGVISEIMVRTYFESQDKTTYLISETLDSRQTDGNSVTPLRKGA